MAISDSRTSKRFRFYLQNATKGLLLLRYTPGGWNTGRFELKRNEKYWGLFRSLSFNELTFYKDSRDYIRDVYESEGINGNITFTVQRWDDATGAYINYFVGKLDLSTYIIEESGVKVQVIDTSFAEKVKNRESVKVNLRERTSIEGYEIPAFTEEDMRLTIPDYEIVSRAQWGDRANDDSTQDNHYVPLWLTVSNFTEAQHQSPDVPIADDSGMFINALADYLVTLNINVQGVVNLNTYQLNAQYRMILYNNGVNIKQWLFNVNSTGWEIVFSVTDTEIFTVLTGNDFYLVGSLTKSGTTEYTSCAVDMSVLSSSVNGTSPIAYPFYEAFQRVLQIITDSNDCFKSDKFGRTDSEITAYASDGQLGHIAKGLFIRQAEGFNNSVGVSFTELFKSLSSLFCLGMGIETIGGVDKVVVEDLSYFFDSNVVLDISARVREDAIGKEVIPDKHYNKLTVGYNTFEYLTTGGLAEYNTKMDFTTVLSAIDNGLDLVSKYRGDTQGIINLMKNAASDEDVKGDEDIFIIDSVRRTSPLTGFQARTDEDFITVTGGADAGNCYNLDLTPKRNLLRNGLLLRAGLQKNLGTYVRWQAGDKNTTLATQKTAETEPIVENADVVVNDLTEPFFLPEYYTLECEMKYADLATIQTNQKGLIKIAPLKYGWIWDLSLPEKENKVTLKLLRANLNVITPVLTPEIINNGLLYNWYAVINENEITSSSDWIVPNKTAFDTFKAEIGSDGGKLKEAGLTYWNDPNEGTANEFLFNFRGTGYRKNTGEYLSKKDIGYIGYRYSASAYTGYSLSNNSGTWSSFLSLNKNYGYPVRLVKTSTTLSNGESGIYIGNDGTIYRTICIGTQEWLADSLAETKYRNGDNIPVVKDNSAWAALTTGAMCAYDNNLNNV